MGRLDLTPGLAGIAALVVFIAAYALVVTEEFTQLRKSKPVMPAAQVHPSGHVPHRGELRARNSV